MSKPRRPQSRRPAPHDDDSASTPVAPITAHAVPLGTLTRSIDLPPQTMNALCRAGLGPPTFKIGRRVYGRVSDFNDWLDRVARGDVDATLTAPKRRHLADGEAPSPERPRRRKPGRPKRPPRKVAAAKDAAEKRPGAIS